ncbi:hypothetical protein BC938DRAFT_474060 [Jimgerdemannia flammicorona]|uniref:Uncharacterized protein n=1 Tax=Jimgerdemannia flammicorona TaxID=994334 RepID=A0A433Q386_9FUNG|nr:hypothetical protein BC938DRAFT_474060 [Jimgerdemannia flammicorona]
MNARSICYALVRLFQISISLERVTVHKGQDTFWTTLGVALGANYNKNELKDIKSSFAFFNAFARNAWEEQKTVVFVDEFDRLYDATNDVRRQCLETFRKIRNNNHLYEVHSITARGTSSELDKCTPIALQRVLYKPVFQRAADATPLRHPGMICLCGRAITENLCTEVDYETRNLTYKRLLHRQAA